jgi:hypothetical protein
MLTRFWTLRFACVFCVAVGVLIGLERLKTGEPTRVLDAVAGSAVAAGITASATMHWAARRRGSRVPSRPRRSDS